MAKKAVTDDIVNAVINGRYGVGDERRATLTQEGYDADEVQQAVNKKIVDYNNASSSTKSTTSLSGSSVSPDTPAATSGTPMSTASKSYITYSSSGKPNYASKYQGQIDELTNQLLNRTPFSYDHTTDDTYKQYEKKYTRQGEIAMRDTLGQVAARTGGLASSYAGTAAQQQYNSYMSALADKIPELRQLAYNMYLNEENSKRNDLSMLLGLEQNEYSHYQNELADWYNQQKLELQRQQLASQQAAQQLAQEKENQNAAKMLKYLAERGEGFASMTDLNTMNALGTQKPSSNNTPITGAVPGAMTGLNNMNALGEQGNSNNPNYILDQHGQHISGLTPVTARKYLELQVDQGGLKPDEALELWNAYTVAPKTLEELKRKTGSKNYLGQPMNYMGPAAYAQSVAGGQNYGGYTSYDQYLAEQWNTYLEGIFKDPFNDQYLLGGL